MFNGPVEHPLHRQRQRKDHERQAIQQRPSQQAYRSTSPPNKVRRQLPKPHRTWKHQIEMQKRGRQEQGRERANPQHDRIDPRVRGGSQSANQHQEQQTTHHEENSAGVKLRLSHEYEKADEKERQPDHAQVEVGAAADLIAPQAHGDLLALIRAGLAHVVWNLVADPAAVELGRRRAPVTVDQLARDAQDLVTPLDPGEIGAAARHHLTHHQAGRLRIEHDAVERPRPVHVENRQTRQA